MNQAAYQLTITLGPRQGQKYTITKDETILGRDENVDIVQAKALLGNRPMPVPGKDGVQCQRTINAIYRAAREHAPVVFE